MKPTLTFVDVDELAARRHRRPGLVVDSRGLNARVWLRRRYRYRGLTTSSSWSSGPLAAALFCVFVEDFVASFLAAFFASFLDVSPPGLAACARSLAAALFCALVEDFAPSFFPAFLRLSWWW
jgi:hypothetical protein